MKITTNINLTEVEFVSLEMHSVDNILTVISNFLQTMQEDCDYPNLFDGVLKIPKTFAEAGHSKNKSIFNQKSLQRFHHEIEHVISKLKKKQPFLNDGTPVDEHKKVIKNVFEVFEIRMEEILQQWNEPDTWIPIPVDSFIDDFKKFFYAMEKNSMGRYKIIYNIAQQEDNDYLVNFAVNSDRKQTINMPLILKDVIRDLVANARKYTPRGGKINIGIAEYKGQFKFVVEDTGYGIPADEIERVVEYGYRASNVKEKIRTMGSGYGLTKALQVLNEFNGDMWIKSEEGKGTKITVKIPIPKHLNI